VAALQDLAVYERSRIMLRHICFVFVWMSGEGIIELSSTSVGPVSLSSLWAILLMSEKLMGVV
jgi:hypothetical protein